MLPTRNRPSGRSLGGPRADSAWREFEAWCDGRRLRALPAHPWTVAAFIRWCEGRRSPVAVSRALRAIARVHLLHKHKPPDRHPTVVRTLRAVEAREAARPLSADLFDAESALRPESGPDVEGRNKRAAKRGKRRILSASPRLVRRRPKAAP